VKAIEIGGTVEEDRRVRLDEPLPPVSPVGFAASFLKHIVAEQTLDIQALKSGGGKKVVVLIARREAVGRLQALGTSPRRACRVIWLSTSTWRYQRQEDPTNVKLLAR
jgi:hypothetical protein